MFSEYTVCCLNILFISASNASFSKHIVKNESAEQAKFMTGSSKTSPTAFGIEARRRGQSDEKGNFSYKQQANDSFSVEG